VVDRHEIVLECVGVEITNLTLLGLIVFVVIVDHPISI